MFVVDAPRLRFEFSTKQQQKKRAHQLRKRAHVFLKGTEISGTFGVSVVLCQVCCGEAIDVFVCRVCSVDQQDFTALRSER